jgi:hypothetical protein
MSRIMRTAPVGATAPRVDSLVLFAVSFAAHDRLFQCPSMGARK